MSVHKLNYDNVLIIDHHIEFIVETKGAKSI